MTGTAEKTGRSQTRFAPANAAVDPRNPHPAPVAANAVIPPIPSSAAPAMRAQEPQAPAPPQLQNPKKRKAPSPAARLNPHESLGRLHAAFQANDVANVVRLAARIDPALDCLRQTLACQAAQRGRVPVAQAMVAASDDLHEARFWVGRQLIISDQGTLQAWLAQPNLKKADIARLSEVAIHFGRVERLTELLTSAAVSPTDAAHLLDAARQFPRPAILQVLEAHAGQSSRRARPPAAHALKPDALALLDGLNLDDAAVLQMFRATPEQSIHSCLGDLLSHAAALGRGSIMVRCIKAKVIDAQACRDVLDSNVTTYTVALSAMCSGDDAALSLLRALGNQSGFRRAAEDSFGPQAKHRALNLLPPPEDLEAADTEALDLLAEAADTSAEAEDADAHSPALSEASVTAVWMADVTAQLAAQNLRIEQLQRANAALQSQIDAMRQQMGDKER